jgi:hypothetical protein
VKYFTLSPSLSETFFLKVPSVLNSVNAPTTTIVGIFSRIVACAAVCSASTKVRVVCENSSEPLNFAARSANFFDSVTSFGDVPEPV